MKSDLFDLVLFVKHETAAAILVYEESVEKAIWLPKSLIEIERDSPRKGLITVTLPEWLAIDKGLV